MNRWPSKIENASRMTLLNTPASDANPNGFRDVRMRGFRKRTPLAEAILLLDGRIRLGKTVGVDLRDAAGRVLAESILSSVNIPGFRRAAMDGFAIRGQETICASPENPIELRIVGESWPGRACPKAIAPGKAIQIMTGAPAPEGADAVIPVEQVEMVGSTIRVTAPIPAGKNISSVGEDIAEGRLVLSQGRRMRPQDVGLLASIGVGKPLVYAAPTIALLVTGDQLLPPGSKPEGYRIVDSNSVMLTGLLRREWGGTITSGLSSG